MELLLVILIAAVLAYVMTPRKRAPSRSPDTPARSMEDMQRVLDANIGWLRERWALAEEHRQPQSRGIFPRWFYDDATERQLARLARMHIDTGGRILSKGQASDVIGLFEPADEENADILKHFGVVLQPEVRNETRARHEVAKLMLSAANQEAWRNRPASALQKAFFGYFGVALPRGLSQPEADDLIEQHLEAWGEAKRREWEAFEMTFEDLSDAEIRADIELKKVPLSVYSEAFKKVLAAGGDVEDPYVLGEQIKVLRPDLKRR